MIHTSSSITCFSHTLAVPASHASNETYLRGLHGIRPLTRPHLRRRPPLWLLAIGPPLFRQSTTSPRSPLFYNGTHSNATAVPQARSPAQDTTYHANALHPSVVVINQIWASTRQLNTFLRPGAQQPSTPQSTSGHVEGPRVRWPDRLSLVISMGRE